MKIKTVLMLATLTLVAAGCILSAQWSLKVPFKVSEPFANGIVAKTVNLVEEDDTWADHSDQIDQIEKVGFDAVVVGLTAGDSLDMYLSADSTYASRAAVLAAATAKDAFPLLLGYIAPGGTDTLTRVEAEALLQLSGPNFTSVKNLVKTGLFTAYITKSGGAAVGSIDTANVYITFTASK